MGMQDEPRVDFDESGDECIISETGSTCLNADVAAPIRVDNIDVGHRGPAGRRPAPVNFDKLSIADFKKPWGTDSAPDFAPAAPPAPVPRTSTVALAM